MKKTNKEKDIALIKRSIDVVLSEIPGISIAWGLSKALYGNALEIRHKKALEWIMMVYENQQIFTKELLQNEQFQDGFVGALEDYLRLRIRMKRNIAQKIFISYASTDDQELFDLEKCNNTLRLISANAINFMKFICTDLEPKRQDRIEKDFLLHDPINRSASEDEIRQSINSQQQLSYVFDEWLIMHPSHNMVMVPNKPNPKYPTHQSSSGVYIKDKQVSAYLEALNELVSLGIIKRDRYVVTEPGWDQKNKMHDSWNYTEFGEIFSNFIVSIND